MRPIADTTERRRLLRGFGVLLAAGSVVVFAIAAVALLAPSLLPDALTGHGGNEVADPAVDAADDGLVEATSQLHGHLNWVIWGPPGARVSPQFATLADRTVVRAREEGAEEVVRLVDGARDLALLADDLSAAHDALEEAERIASGGEPQDERYVVDPDAAK